jgi:hypothetical protein
MLHHLGQLAGVSSCHFQDSLYVSDEMGGLGMKKSLERLVWGFRGTWYCSKVGEGACCGKSRTSVSKPGVLSYDGRPAW